MPSISVVMNIYREPEGWLRKSIESVLNQTLSDFEFIIILDDPKNKLHRDIVGKYAIQDQRIRMMPNSQNLGVGRTLNRGIKAARGDYFAHIDGDDICYPDRLQKQYDFLESHPDIALVGSWTNRINAEGESIGLSRFPESPTLIRRLMPFQMTASHPTWMVRKEALVEAGGYRPFPAAPDYDMLFRLIDAGYQVSNIQEPLVYYRINPDSITNTRAFKQKICVSYIRELHRERKHSGNDTFSEEELNSRISASQAQEGKLEKAHGHFLKAVAAKGKQNYLGVISSLVKSAWASALQRRLFADYALAKWVKLRWRWFGN